MVHGKRIKTKLILSFAVVIAMVLFLTLPAYTTVNNLDEEYSYVPDFPEKRLQTLKDFDSHLIGIRRATATLSLFAMNSESVETYWKQYEEAYADALEHIEEYIEFNNNDTVRDPALLKGNVDAVQEISEASHSINKVIKVIDDERSVRYAGGIDCAVQAERR